MAPQDELEYYEATEAQDLTRLLRALRPPCERYRSPRRWISRYERRSGRRRCGDR
jgi:hypothetical protein